MAKAIKTNTVFPNVVKREFTKNGARKVLLTDITYIFYDGGVCYLSTILDAYTIDYYNNDRYQWDLAKLPPREFYQYTTTGVYPLTV